MTRSTKIYLPSLLFVDVRCIQSQYIIINSIKIITTIYIIIITRKEHDDGAFCC